MHILTQVLGRLLSEPWDLWRRGVTSMRSGSEKTRVTIVWLAVLTCVLADGVSTYLLLHPSQNNVFIEGNPGASAVMALVGLNGWIFVGNFMCLVVLPAALIAKPLTPFQRLVWWGGAVTVAGKIASGSWNAYLYYITS